MKQNCFYFLSSEIRMKMTQGGESKISPKTKFITTEKKFVSLFFQEIHKSHFFQDLRSERNLFHFFREKKVKLK